MSQAESLLTKYVLCKHQVDMPGRAFQIYSIAGVDQLVEQAVTEDDLPFWADLWPAAIALASYLWRTDLQGVPVLELGAGAGLAGIIAAARGAEVLQTDLMVEALELAKYNAEINAVTGIRWLQADWRAFPIHDRFPLLIGSDIAYEPVVHSSLVDVVCGCTEPQGRFILADPGRAPALDLVGRFLEKGWYWQVEQQAVPWENREVTVHLHILVAPKFASREPLRR